MLKDRRSHDWLRIAVVLAASALPIAAQQTGGGGPVLPGSSGEEPVPTLSARATSLDEFIGGLVNPAETWALIDIVLADNHFPVPNGHVVVNDDGALVGQFALQKQQGAAVTHAGDLHVVVDIDGVAEVVGTRALKNKADGGYAMTFRLVSDVAPDEVYEQTLEYDGGGLLLGTSGGGDGGYGTIPGTGWFCIKRCYQLFVGGYFNFPFLYWYHWKYFLWAPLYPFYPQSWSFWTYIYYVKWFALLNCKATC